MDAAGSGSGAVPARSSMAWLFGSVLRGLLVCVTRWFTGVVLRPGALAQLSNHAGAPRILFANHNSLADFIVLWTALPRPMRRQVRPVAAADHWGRSAWRRFLAQEVFHAVLIERSGGSDMRAGLAAMAHALSQGGTLIFFPEGTRNTGDAPLQPFKPGLYLLAQACPTTTLVPVWLDQTRRVLPKGAEWPVPALCTVNIGPAMLWAPGEACDAFLRRAQGAVWSLRPDAQAAALQQDDPVAEVRAA